LLIVDAHEDLAWSALSFGRDYTLSAAQIRIQEQNSQVPVYNDDAMLGWPDYQRGQVALVFASLYATPIRWRAGDWDRLCYQDDRQAARLFHQQIDFYLQLTDEHSDKFHLILSRPNLQDLLRLWETSPQFSEQTGDVKVGNPVGLLLLMEGADAVRDPGELDEWWDHGVRIIGPAWVGTRYCGGNKEPGPLTDAGFALLERMAELGFGLDLSHMDEKAVLQALDVFPGVIFASHSNAQALLKGDQSNRHLSDRVIHGIFERGGLIGVHVYNAFLKAGWVRGDPREEVGLERVIQQIDYYCQIAGDAAHVGVGSDLDGGLGLQSVPVGLDSIADLQKIAPLLMERGYTTKDCASILGQNWLSLASRILPESL
jgi:membrane dipeptidase